MQQFTEHLTPHLLNLQERKTAKYNILSIFKIMLYKEQKTVFRVRNLKSEE